jgi:hypothetical protein
MRPITRGVTLDGDRIYFARMYQLNDIKAGRHDLVITIKDSLSGQSASERVTFTVRETEDRRQESGVRRQESGDRSY